MKKGDVIVDTKKILLIEDNAKDRRLLKLIFAKTNHRLIEADDGQEGWEKALVESPDLIILDLRLPSLSGWDVLTRLRGQPSFAKIPIVVITACAMKGDREKILAAGGSAYFSKPLDIKRFVSEIEVYFSGV